LALSFGGGGAVAFRRGIGKAVGGTTVFAFAVPDALAVMFDKVTNAAVDNTTEFAFAGKLLVDIPVPEAAAADIVTVLRIVDAANVVVAVSIFPPTVWVTVATWAGWVT